MTARFSTVHQGYDGRVRTASEVRGSARRAANSAWFDGLARLGFCARGVVYGVIGLLGLEIALNASPADPTASKEGALREIAQQPFGRFLLVLLAAGLAAHALWRASEALLGEKVGRRLHSAGDVVIYVVVLVSTLKFIRRGPGAGGEGGDKQEEALTARILDLPWGQVIVGGVGIGLIAGGLYMAYRGLSQRFEKRLDTSTMGPVLRPVVDTVGTLGLAARGVVFSLMGFVALKAAVDFDPEDANGFDGTLQLIANRTYGEVLLSVVAVGLVAYALYSFAEARYREL